MAAFRKNTGFSGPLYTDTTLEVHRALGFKKSIGSLFGFKTVAETLKATGAGILPKGIQGAPTQQGGALVAGPGDSLLYIYRSREAGDHPPVEEMLDAVREDVRGDDDAGGPE